MASYIGRRKFLVALGGAAAWPVAAHAQQSSRMRRIGLLQGLAESDPETQARTVAFRQALEALGWTEGRNIHIDYRFAGGDPARVEAYAVELVNAAPDLIVGHSTPVAAALKQATSTIPIVLALVNDPLGQGFVASLARPGANITGFANIEFTMVGKWLELLKEMVPHVRRVAFIFNPLTAPYYPVFLRELEASPARLPAELVAAPVHDEGEIEAAIVALAREPAGGLIAAGKGDRVRRRAFITLLGGAAAAWPLAARAQQPERVRRIGVLMGYAGSDSDAQATVAAFQEGLNLGWVEGRNITWRRC